MNNPATLRPLLTHPALWLGDRLAPAPPGVATGFAELDAVLPGGGWPVGALTELLPARAGIGELSLLMPALAKLSREDERWLVWVAPPHVPYAPALAAAGLDLARLIIVRPRSGREALWATRQALATKSASAVLAWLNTPDMQSLRRLQLAAEGSQALACLFRPPHAAQDFSPAPLRLRLEAGEGRLAVHVLKRRGPRLARPVLIARHLLQPHNPHPPLPLEGGGKTCSLPLAGGGKTSPLPLAGGGLGRGCSAPSSDALDRPPLPRAAPAGVPARAGA